MINAVPGEGPQLGRGLLARQLARQFATGSAGKRAKAFGAGHHGYVDADQVTTLRALLARSGWLDRAGTFGRALRTSTRSSGGLLLVGTPSYEPWHLTAHLDEESRLSGIPELMPTLVRWSPPPDAPPHLRVGLSRLEAARRGETLFVVSSETAPVPLLERVDDARRTGATILALGGAAGGDRDLESLAHESLSIPMATPALAASFDDAGLAGRMGLLTFDAAQHLVSAAAGDRDTAGPRGAGDVRGIRDAKGAGSPRGLRERVARLLDFVSGSNPAG
jgi:hypothetical protein